MAVAVVQVVGVVAMRDRLVTAARTVLVPPVVGMGLVRGFAFVPVAVVLVVDVAIVEVVDMVAVLHRRVATIGTVDMGVGDVGVTSHLGLLVPGPQSTAEALHRPATACSS